MNKETFWALIKQSHSINTDEMLENLQMEISKLPIEDQQLFRGYLTAYLEQISECIWVDMACKVINGYVSDDTGLYFALWLIAQGESVLLNALKDPDSLARLENIPFGTVEFELLMSIGMDEDADYETIDRLREKCSSEIESSIVYKNGDKYGGYDDFDNAMEDIPNILPELIARAAKAGFDWKGLYGI